MKKQLSMFLVLALLTVLYGGAFADTLQLPGSLTTIEAESFSDNPALDEVSVAWGTETIESRAFASSGVKKIYIPATVTAIADDAFAGTSVTICSAEDSYAKEYADAHGLAWEDSGNHDRKSAVSQLVDYSAKFRGPECEPLAMLDRLPTEGIEDPQELARVEQYNAAVDDLNADLASLNQHEAEISDALNGCVDQLPALTVTERGGRVHMDMDGLSMVMDKTVMDAMEQGVEIVATDADDRGVTRLTASNGATWYIYQIGDTYYYTGTAPSASAHVNDAIAEANGRDDGPLARFTGLVDQVENIVSNVDLLFNDNLSFFNGELARIEQKFQNLNVTESNLTGRAKELAEKLQAQRQRELNIIRAKRATWIAGAKIWAGLDIAANILILRQIIIDWTWLNEISDHKHPNEHDTSARSRDIANTMNRDILILRGLFITDGILSVVQLISSIGLFAAAVPTGGAAVASKVVIAAIKMIAGVLLNAGEDNKKDAIDRAEQKLHTYVYGWVKEKGTGKPIGQVKVAYGDAFIETDANGYYELYLMPEQTSLEFTRDGYKKDGIVATPVAGEGTQVQDMELRKEGTITISGIVCSITNLNWGLENVLVQCDEFTALTDWYGKYTITARLGSDLVFSKGGYATRVFTIPWDGQITFDPNIQMYPY